jgi:hypothetical protein
MEGRIFISYRRSETAWAARALFERLRREFGERVFIDIEGLSLGTDFTKIIDEHLEDCEVMLAIIGHNWLEEIQRRAAAGATPILSVHEDDSEPDWVCVELTRGLLRGIPVVPVLIEGASMPAKRALPTELKGLSNRNGMELHARFFDDQTGRLVREIAKIIGMPSSATAIRVAEPPAIEFAERQMQTLPGREQWMSNEGTDNFGRWAEFEVKGSIQRMRWIPLGKFWMGSPDTETGRGDDELLHIVACTRGFWLADSTCTQAMWQAVLGTNPSYFTGDPSCPVEQVSYDEIQRNFLPKLNNLVVGLQATLPTEAQWEYACRAGSQTPFSSGLLISPNQANSSERSR